MSRVLIVCGRLIVENSHRELCLKAAFEEKGHEVTFCLPGRTINAAGFMPDAVKEPLFQSHGAVWLDSLDDFSRLVSRHDAVVFGSWKNYWQLSRIAKSKGRPVIDYQSSGGFEHWPGGVDLACVRSTYSKRRLLCWPDTRPSGVGLVTEDQMVITGSCQLGKTFVGRPQDTEKREKFCRAYDLDPSRPIVTFFPKAVGQLDEKVGIWFSEKTDKERAAYSGWLKDKYGEICHRIVEAKCNLVVKMHPHAYAGYRTTNNWERDYWSRIPEARIVFPADVNTLFEVLDIGVGTDSHIALDMGYFGKPFVYVDSDLLEPPPNWDFEVLPTLDLPLGPSSHWDDKPSSSGNLWFPSWLGHACRAADLPALLSDPTKYQIRKDHWKSFIKEFWHTTDGRDSARNIVTEAASIIERFSRPRRYYMISRHAIGTSAQSVRNHTVSICHRLARGPG